jgi:tetratricopeptide (TPR) repeat protein/RsiW-degrading membrane proteinase PrsW (M82 family)
MILILSSRVLALPAALIAGALLALVLLRLGRQRFSLRLFGFALAWGAAAALPPAVISIIEARFDPGLSSFWDAALKAFGLAGLCEEGAKLIVAYLFVRPYAGRRTPRDLALAVATVALGFALIENVLYVFAAADRWPAAALARMATAAPIHVLIGLVLGGGLVRADEKPPGAARALIIGQTWLVAALLHGFYDFPLFLTAHAPLYPTPVTQFALAFSVTTPTLLSAIYLAAVLAAGIGAARVVVWLERTAEPPTLVARRPFHPQWLARFVFARATGLVLGALLLIPSAIWIAVAINATIAGVMPVMTLDALSVCAASAMIGVTLLLPTAPAAAPQLPARRRRLLAFGALVVVLAAALVFHGAIDSARRNLLADALVVSGNSYGAQGELERAMQNYDSALAYRPEYAPALFQRALANRTYQRYDLVLADLDSAVRIAPDDTAVLSERANAYENLHQPDKAIADLDHALTIKADDPALLSVRAEILANAGEFDKAGADLDRAIAVKPDLALAHAARGDIFLQKFDYDSALRELDEAIRLDPNSATPYFTRGRLRYFRGEFPMAIADLQQANARQPDPYSALWLFLSRGRGGQNGREELVFWAGRLSPNAWPFPLIELYVGARPAPSVFSAAANADQSCEADFYIAEWLIQQKLEQPATLGLKHAVATCPKSFIEYGGAVAELKKMTPPNPPPTKPDETKPALAAPIPSEAASPAPQAKMDPAPAQAATLPAVEPPPADPATAEAQEAIQRDPIAAAPHVELGAALQAHGKLVEAIAEFREAIRLAPDDAAARAQLGQALLELSRSEAADQQVVRLREACDQFLQGAQRASSDPRFPILEGIIDASLAGRGHCPP